MLVNKVDMDKSCVCWFEDRFMIDKFQRNRSSFVVIEQTSSPYYLKWKNNWENLVCKKNLKQ